MPLHFERLEDRRLLAAGISLAGGTLKIEGDNNANNIFVRGDEEGLIYAGLDRNGDNDFDDPGDLLTVYEADLIKSIVINSKGGDDIVIVEPNAVLTGDIVVNTAGGSDIVTVYAAARDIRVNTGNGNDLIYLFQSEAERNVTLNTGAGDDLVSAVFTQAGRNLTINTGAGDDAVLLELAFVGGKVDIKLGAGNDVFNSYLFLVLADPAKFTLDGGGGQDRLAVQSHEFLDAIVDAGARIKNFEFIEDAETLTPATLASIDLMSYRFSAADERQSEFYDAVLDIMGPIT